MESTRRETSYALMEPAFLRQIVNEASTGSGAQAPAGRAAGTRSKSWYADAAAWFLALGRARSAERR
jgi:hypothetical protein